MLFLILSFRISGACGLGRRLSATCMIVTEALAATFALRRRDLDCVRDSAVFLTVDPKWDFRRSDESRVFVAGIGAALYRLIWESAAKIVPRPAGAEGEPQTNALARNRLNRGVGSIRGVVVGWRQSQISLACGQYRCANGSVLTLLVLPARATML